MDTPRFKVGDKVKAVALPFGWPIPRPEVPNLTVTGVRLIEPSFGKPYYRITATEIGGFGYVEGSEKFFSI